MIKINNMNKTEKRKYINKSVYTFAEALGYDMSDDDMGHYVTLYKPETMKMDDMISYSRSGHDACCVNWANEEVQRDTDKINEFIKILMASDVMQ
jgi:hypothetical protein